MEKTQIPERDILRNRADLLTTAVIECNSWMGKYQTAMLWLTSGKAYFQVKVVNTDSYDEIVDVVVLEHEKIVVDLVIKRVQENLHAYQSRHVKFMSELNSINRQLTAMGSSDQVGQ